MKKNMTNLELSTVKATDFYVEGVTETKGEKLKSAEQCTIYRSNLTAEADSFVFFGEQSVDFPVQCVHQLFELQASISPLKIAAVSNNIIMTYAELNQKANQLAQYLTSTGVTMNTPTAILMNRSLHCLVSILALMKAGVPYVPIDINYPKKRIEYIFADSDIKHIVVDSESETLINSIKSNIKYVINAENNLLYQGEGKNLNLKINGDQAVYYIYTSGSTGQPKGVMVHHHGLTNYVVWARKNYVTDQINNFAFYSSLAFDLTVTSVMVPLVSGKCIHIYPDIEDADLPIVRAVEENRVDLLKLTPSHLTVLDNIETDLSNLKTLILGGEDLKADRALKTYNQLDKKVAIYNEYGPTETVVGCMIYRFDPTKDVSGSVPIGVPIDNTRIYLLDENLVGVEKGMIGHIHIVGDGVALGYKNKPEITSRCFIKNPFENSLMYASGDLGKLNDFGQLVYMGRADHQIKIRGYRVELGEIENILQSHDKISECVVDTGQLPGPAITMGTDRETFCCRCGLSSRFPNIRYNNEGVCNHCTAFDKYRDTAKNFFKTKDDLKRLLYEVKSKKNGEYDCLMALSGGKDSTYALCQVMELLDVRVMAYTLDNGFISQGAKDNIDRIVRKLGVEHRYLSTPAMNEIFVESLHRHSNVCNGCFKTIYTLGMKLALELGISHIITGLSRGQLFETRLNEMYKYNNTIEDKIEQDIITARKIYHRMDDAVSRLLDTDFLNDDTIFERIHFIDFYRYFDVEVAEMYLYLKEKIGWERPADTGRSTNCMINDVGIYVHNKERGYHNYSLPYSWDVRLGHKKRDTAMEELSDFRSIDEQKVHAMMAEIGYEFLGSTQENKDPQLVGYYVSDTNISSSELRSFMSEYLPDYMIPSHFIQLDRLPLTPNGKVNRQALPKPDASRRELNVPYVAPCNDNERRVAMIWRKILDIENIGVHENFFDIGGNSLPAAMMLFKVSEIFNQNISIHDFMGMPTIRTLSDYLQQN